MPHGKGDADLLSSVAPAPLGPNRHGATTTHATWHALRDPSALQARALLLPAAPWPPPLPRSGGHRAPPDAALCLSRALMSARDPLRAPARVGRALGTAYGPLARPAVHTGCALGVVPEAREADFCCRRSTICREPPPPVQLCGGMWGNKLTRAPPALISQLCRHRWPSGTRPAYC
jgi:hypothetical protein